MRYDSDIHRRRSIRLREYDYRQAGAYFVTVCTHEREPLLDNQRLHGIVERAWYRLPGRFEGVALDEFVVMPNHVHGIVWIRRDAVGARRPAPSSARMIWREIQTAFAPGGRSEASPLRPALRFHAPPSGSLGVIMGSFKADSTRRINRIRGTPGAAVWQRGYYERIIRDEAELNAIRQYIRDNRDNPSKWANDPNNPANIGRQT